MIFHEERGLWATDQLNRNASRLLMSTINYAEVVILVQSRQPRMSHEIRAEVLATGIRFIPPTAEQAEIAAEARFRYPLNLGDCFAYALAKSEDCPLLTLDRDFRRADIDLVLPPRS